MPADMSAMESFSEAQPAGGPRLTGRQKAAIIVRLLLEDGASPVLHSIPEGLQAELARQFPRMNAVTKATISEVVDEFAAAANSVGLSFPHDLEGAISSLDGVISTAAIARLRRETGMTELNTPWERVNGIEAERLAEYIRRESPEIAAVMLSKLKTAKAAEILGLLPGEMARRITYSISLTGAIAPETVHRIGLTLSTELNAEPPRAFADGPVGRVGEILNAASTATRDSVLAGLEEEDEAFAEQVKKSLFTFADIARRVSQRDIARIQRRLDQDDIVMVKAGASGSNEVSIDFILSGISQRLADMMRTQAEELGGAGEADVDEAMNRIVAVIREMEKEGDLRLTPVED